MRQARGRARRQPNDPLCPTRPPKCSRWPCNMQHAGHVDLQLKTPDTNRYDLSSCILHARVKDRLYDNGHPTTDDFCCATSIEIAVNQFPSHGVQSSSKTINDTRWPQTYRALDLGRILSKVNMRPLTLALTLMAPASASASVSTGSLKDIKHIVLFMQENRSFDHVCFTPRCWMLRLLMTTVLWHDGWCPQLWRSQCPRQ